MKRILAVAVALFAFAAFADDVHKTETKTETKTGAKKSTTKAETKTTNDPDGLMNSTTDTAKAERKVESNDMGGTTTTTEKTTKHDAPGMKDDAKMNVKSKTTRDANGNVVKEEVKVK